MKKMGIKEGNLIIAEFDGWKNDGISPFAKELGKNDVFDYVKEKQGYSEYNYGGDFKYNTSWDALMPVVEKIAEMKFPIHIYISHIQKSVEIHDLKSGHYAVRESSTMQSPLESTWRAVVDFLKLHNKKDTKNEN